MTQFILHYYYYKCLMKTLNVCKFLHTQTSKFIHRIFFISSINKTRDLFGFIVSFTQFLKPLSEITINAHKNENSFSPYFVLHHMHVVCTGKVVCAFIRCGQTISHECAQPRFLPYQQDILENVLSYHSHLNSQITVVILDNIKI